MRIVILAMHLLVLPLLPLRAEVDPARRVEQGPDAAHYFQISYTQPGFNSPRRLSPRYGTHSIFMTANSEQSEMA